MWELVPTDKYLKASAIYEKKHPHELSAVLSNLDSYVKALNSGCNPLQISGGFIHPEPEGIVAIDQKGGKQKIKLQQTRLYIYPQTERKLLYLITIGDKRLQGEDIKLCRAFVREIRKEEPNG